MINYSITSLLAGRSPGSSGDTDLFSMCAEENVFMTLYIYAGEVFFFFNFVFCLGFGPWASLF